MYRFKSFTSRAKGLLQSFFDSNNESKTTTTTNSNIHEPQKVDSDNFEGRLIKIGYDTDIIPLCFRDAIYFHLINDPIMLDAYPEHCIDKASYNNNLRIQTIEEIEGENKRTVNYKINPFTNLPLRKLPQEQEAVRFKNENALKENIEFFITSLEKIYELENAISTLVKEANAIKLDDLGSDLINDDKEELESELRHKKLEETINPKLDLVPLLETFITRMDEIIHTQPNPMYKKMEYAEIVEKKQLRLEVIEKDLKHFFRETPEIPTSANQHQRETDIERFSLFKPYSPLPNHSIATKSQTKFTK